MKSAMTLIVIGFVAMVSRWAGDGNSDSRPEASSTSVEWPATFEGQPLTQLPLTVQERSFAEGFPGSIARFKDGAGNIVILRNITRPSRKLHPSSDCLRANGFSIGSAIVQGSWKTYDAEFEGQSFQVRERIDERRSSGRTWTEVSAWWWDASRGSSDGPWLAVTVIEEIR